MSPFASVVMFVFAAVFVLWCLWPVDPGGYD